MPTHTAKKTTSHKSKAGSKSTQKARTVRKTSPQPRPVRFHLSRDRKIDLLGIFLALGGVLTGLSLLSPSHGTITGWWVESVSLLVGWGIFLLPFLSLAVGLWLVLRNIEHLPIFSVERLLGVVLFFLDLLTWMHLFANGDLTLAQAGKGGGYLGGIIEQGLISSLGVAGSVIVLLALLLVSLVLTFDLSVSDLFRRLVALLGSISWFQKKAPGVPDPEFPSARPEVETGEPLTDFVPFIHPRPQNKPKPQLTQTPVNNSSVVADTLAETAGTRPAVKTSPPQTLPVTVWKLPRIEDILESGSPAVDSNDYEKERARIIEETLASFGAPGHIVEIHKGPTITQFGVEPDFLESRAGRTRVRVSKIVSLADDLALALAAQRIRIQAPVPGRAYVGIEVPNDEISRVMLRDVIESESFKKVKSPLRFALGKDVAGKAVAYDLASMPHLLIAGTTGSGKSVCVNAILSCFLMNNSPDDLRLILVDPKRVELTGYNGIPQLLSPVVVDPDRVVGALQWAMREMDNRYQKFAKVGARNIVDYNKRLLAGGEKPIPYLVVVIDELADLMMLAPEETERTITRLAQLARATGLHLIIATQRPSVNVLTGLIKANFPARIAFAVASNTDSRVILDQPGAERLLGRGDMLFQAPDAPAPVRLQGAFVSESEISRLVEYWRDCSHPEGSQTQDGQPAAILPPSGVPLKQTPLWEDMAPVEEGDPLLKDAIDLVRREGRASISMLQRRMRIGYSRAARLIDTMEAKGIISSSQNNTQLRQILDYGPTAPPKEE